MLLDALPEGVGSAGINGVSGLFILMLQFDLLPPFLQMTEFFPLERDALLAEVVEVRSNAE